MSLKTTLLFAFLLMMTGISAQDSPGLRPELLVAKNVKIKPLPEAAVITRKGYHDFYTDAALHQRYAQNKNQGTTYTALENRVLKVVSVEPYIFQNEKSYRVKLADTIKNETIYYKFSKNSEKLGNYYFEVLGGLTYPDDFFCDYLKTPMAQNGEQKIIAALDEGVTITKVKKGKTVTYMLEANIMETTVSMKRGISFTLESGHKIERPEQEITMGSKNDHVTYTTTFELTPAEVSQLAASPVKDWKIAGFERNFKEGAKFAGMVKCQRTR
ncbi:MAG: hypothetical protein ACO1N9_05575 [Flavobacterium sp.]